MRTVFLVAVLTLMSGVSSSFAQSTTEGPLAAPESKPASKPMKPKSRKVAKTAHHVPSKSEEPVFDPDRAAAADPVAHRSTPSDPLSFGMKWNGSNESASQTRGQNYDGNAQGTGAEVGLKLHF